MNKPLCFAFVALALLLRLHPTAIADIVVDDLSETTVGVDSSNTFDLAAQSFITSNQTELLASVTVKLIGADSGGGPIVFSLNSDNSDQPGSSLVSLGTATPAGSGYANYLLNPASSVTLNTNTRYWVVGQYLGEPSWAYTASTSFNGSGTLSDLGNRFINSTNWNIFPITDEPYQIQVVATVPEPSTLALLTLGAIGLISVRRRFPTYLSQLMGLCIMTKSSCLAKIRVIVVIAVTVVVGGLSPFSTFISSAIGAPVPIGLGSFSGTSTVIDFNSIADEQLITNQFVGQGVTFGGAIYGMTNPGDTNLFPSNGGGVIASNWLYSQTANQGTSFTATFSSTENRIGFYAETNDVDDTTISVLFGGNPNGPITFDTALSTIFFIGVEDLSGFDSVTVSVSGPFNHFLAVDDFRFEAVPEPSTLALLCLGGFGLLMRRRSA